ncbi:hypothetical protein MWU53_14660 [Aliiroseovarius sp. S1123]|uniref:hypothetical protein n=1 Tax=unclassified Aliiroseovarius TaxID=2623558 RepID=UPI001FF27A34|nr:hypothetical protein [Aliiroseovarius sp. S1123]MCK0172302.1 hypothetical protein [Aliiroseovarius sp. S1123]
MADPLSQLADVTALQLDRAMSELSDTAAKIATLKRQIAELRTRLNQLPGLDAETGQNPALSSGHFDQWQKQARTRLGQLNTLLAQARAEHEERMVDTQLAFGRNAALNAIRAKRTADVRDMQRRRVEHQ